MNHHCRIGRVRFKREPAVICAYVQWQQPAQTWPTVDLASYQQSQLVSRYGNDALRRANEVQMRNSSNFGYLNRPYFQNQ